MKDAEQQEKQQANEQDPSDKKGEEETLVMNEPEPSEDEQATEQWLRQIPDDPGGLLRRKFKYQYQRLGRDQDGNSVWPGDEERPY